MLLYSIKGFEASHFTYFSSRHQSVDFRKHTFCNTCAIKRRRTADPSVTSSCTKPVVAKFYRASSLFPAKQHPYHAHTSLVLILSPPLIYLTFPTDLLCAHQGVVLFILGVAGLNISVFYCFIMMCFMGML